MKNSFLLIISLVGVALIGTSPVNATSGFEAGRIIDDSIFTNKTTMSVADIQTFLNSKVASCDTNGQQLSEFGGPDLNGDGKVQRWEWGKQNYNQTTFPCLKDYTQDGVSAAQLIYNASQTYSINPQVMIVLLQKEQGLVTDTWPLSVQYRSATGYGCPDTAACDSQYYGLKNQLNWAATMFRAILNNSPTWYTPYVLGNNYIQYNPNSSCGGSNVNIVNRSTQALYNYTPYQPSQAALDAGWGTVSCGAYGNRNFYLYFNSWFGSTTENSKWQWALVSQEAFIDSNYTQPMSTYEPSVKPSVKFYAQITARNTGNRNWDKMTRIATNNPTDRSSIFYDSMWLSSNRPVTLLENEVLPGAVGTFRFALQAPQGVGTYREYFNLVQDGITSFNDLGQNFTIHVTNPITSRNSSNTSLNVGSALQSGEYLLSPDTNTILLLKEDGDLVLLNGFQPIWNTKTAGNPGSKLIFQSDGNLVLYSKNNTPLWNSETPGSTANALQLQSDRNLVLYSTTNAALWSSSTNTSQSQLDVVVTAAPTNSIIYPGQRIETADRKRYLILQYDGNLVLYSDNKALWATGTDGKAAKMLAVQGDGNMVLYSKSMSPLWNSQTASRGPSRLIIQGDSNLVLYRNDGPVVWATYTNK